MRCRQILISWLAERQDKGAVHLSLRVPIYRGGAISWRDVGLPSFAGNDKSGAWQIRQLQNAESCRRNLSYDRIIFAI